MTDEVAPGLADRGENTFSGQQGEITPSQWFVFRGQRNGDKKLLTFDSEALVYTALVDYKSLCEKEALLKDTCNKELHYVVALWLGEDNFPVLGNSRVTEAELLHPFRTLRNRIGQRPTGDRRPNTHVYFLTCEFKNTCTQESPPLSTEDAEGLLPEMRGIVLNKIQLKSFPEADVLKSVIKQSFDGAPTAGEACYRLQEKLINPEGFGGLARDYSIPGSLPLRVGVPQGRSSKHVGEQATADTNGSKDFAVFIDLCKKPNSTAGSVKSDAEKNFEKICKSLRIDNERSFHLTERSQLDEKVVYIKKLLADGSSVGRIWVFLSAHGAVEGVEDSNGKVWKLDSLLEPLFVELCDREKLIFVDACRGSRDSPSDESTTGSRCNSGLMFSNRSKTGSGDFSIRDNCFIEPSRTRFFAVFASLPGFKTFEYDNCGHLMLSTASAFQKLKGKAVTADELAEVIQNELENNIPRGTVIIQPGDIGGAQTEVASRDPETPIVPEFESYGTDQQASGQQRAAEPKADTNSTRQTCTEGRLTEEIKNIRISSQSSSGREGDVSESDVSESDVSESD